MPIRLSDLDTPLNGSPSFPLYPQLHNVGLFARPSNGGGSSARVELSEQEILRKEAFRLLKPKCVPLTTILHLHPSTNPRTLSLLTDLHSTLELIPNEAFTPSLVNYVLFPLTGLLQRNNPLPSASGVDATGTGTRKVPDRILELILQSISLLLDRWKPLTPTIDLQLFQQLWVLSALLLGGPLKSVDVNGKPLDKGKGKGKEKEAVGLEGMKEETKLAVLGLMQALLMPVPPEELAELTKNSSEMDKDDEEEDLSLAFDQPEFDNDGLPPYPPPQMITHLLSSKILMPILFHTISTLLDLLLPTSTSSHNPNTPLQTTALDLLDCLITIHLKDQPEILATILPGMLSTLVKTMNAGGREVREGVGVRVGRLVGEVVVGTVGDEGLREMGALSGSGVGSLEQLGEMLGGMGMDGEERLDDDIQEIKREDVRSRNNRQNGKDQAKTGGANPNIFPSLTPQYLSFTSTQLLSSFKALIPPLQQHSSPVVRSATVALAGKILLQCNQSLPILHGVLLGVLLGLTMDEFDVVGMEAKMALRKLLTGEEGIAAGLKEKLRDIAEKTLMGFPSAITSKSDKRATESTKLLTALAKLITFPTMTMSFPTQTSTQSPASGLERIFGDLLGPNGGMGRWIWPLLSCLELGRRGEVQVGGQGYAGRAWEMASLGGSYTYLQIEGARSGPYGAETSGETGDGKSQGQGPGARFPELYLRHVESPALLHAVAEMLQSLGAAAGIDAFHAIERLTSIARTKRNTPNVAQAASALWMAEQVLAGVAGSVMVDRKQLKRSAKSIVRLIETFDEEDEGDGAEFEDGMAGGGAEEETNTSLVEHTRGINALTNLLKQEHRGSKTAEVRNRRLHLQTHRELVTALSLSMLSRCAEILGQAFRPTLMHTLYILLSHLGSPIGFIRGYAEIALVRIAYDIGYASSQNLIMDNVDYVINLVSQRMTFKRLSPLAPMVLISMIRLIGEPIVPLVQDIVDDIFDCLDSYHGYEMLASTMLAVLDTLMGAMEADLDVDNWEPPETTSLRMRRGPDPEKDFEKFITWYDGRATRAKEVIDDMLEPTPNKPWGEKAGEEEDAEQEPPANTSDEAEVPPTRAQEVCKQVLEKGIYFLTHQSPFLRARVLSLFAKGVPVLACGDRSADLLGLVNTAWPYILNRLKDDHHYVVTEAAVLVESLARYVGDFMSRRVLDNAWPTMKHLLATQRKLDEKSALVRRGQQAGTPNAFSVSHRLYLAIINAMRYVIQEVPVAESVVWEIILLFRPFLDATAQEDLQQASLALYRALVKRDGDAVWTALMGTLGEMEDTTGSLAYLRQPGLNISDNVALICS